MLEKPEFLDHAIGSHLQQEYGLQVAQLSFLPLGSDVNTAAYRIVGEDGRVTFLKLRKGAFDLRSVVIPQLLAGQGLPAIISPLQNRTGQSLTSLGEYTLVLYPFIAGKDAYDVELSDRQWVEFGTNLNRIHAAQVPFDIQIILPRETYPSHWREMVRDFQAQVARTSYPDPVAEKFAACLQARRMEIEHLVNRAEELARDLRTRHLDFVLCHADIHPGNLLLIETGEFYIVDWDDPILSPKERDLALIGGCYAWRKPSQVASFYQGYGPAPVDRTALAYFRYERIIQDIAAFGEQLLLTNEGGADRKQSLQYSTSIFLPRYALDLAKRVDV